jgi:hypothetical protein
MWFIALLQLWPTFCSENTLPPYIPLDPLPKPGDGSVARPTKALCIDRKTLKPRLISLYSEEVQSIIYYCADRNIQLSICSRIPHVDSNIPLTLLKCFKIDHLFCHPQIYNNRKSYHFRNLNTILGLEYSDFLFFDDDKASIDAAIGMGIPCCLVSKTHGLNVPSFLTGLKTFTESKTKAKERGLGAIPQHTIPEQRLIVGSPILKRKRLSDCEAIVHGSATTNVVDPEDNSECTASLSNTSNNGHICSKSCVGDFPHCPAAQWVHTQ